MANTLDRLFNTYSLVVINLGIIALALTMEGGQFFFRTGLIHLIALIFIGLAVLRILYHHYTYDPILEKFVHAALFALIVFAGSHIIEYTSMMLLDRYEDSVFANVANFYLIGILSVTAGATHFSSINHLGYAAFLRRLSYALIAALLVFSVFLLATDGRAVSLEADAAGPYVYALLLAVAGALAVIEIVKIRRLTPVMRGFTAYLLAGLVTILVAVLPNIFYELLEPLGIPSHASVYISHFLFYAALSLFFLAFEKLSYMGGVYEDLKAIDTV